MTYSIGRVNRNQLLYTEDHRALTLEVESGFDRPIDEPIGPQHVGLMNLVVYLGATRRWDDGRPITSEERERITRNISEALTKAGTKHIIE